MIFFFFRFPVVLLGSPGISDCHATSAESSSLRLRFIVLKCDQFICLFSDNLESYHANRTTNLISCTTSEIEDDVGAEKHVYAPTP